MYRKRASVLILALMLIVGLPLEAQAKGPESATLAGPDVSEPIELISVWKSFDAYENDAPIRLISMMGLWSGPLSPVVIPPSKTGPAYSLTWVNSGPPGDSTEKRTIHQYIYLDAAGGPLIHVPDQDGLVGWGKEVFGWFEAPVELAAVIEEVIAWSATAEAAELQSAKTSSAEVVKTKSASGNSAIAPLAGSSTEPTPDRAGGPIWLVIAAGIGVGGLAIWLVRQTRRPDVSPASVRS